MARWGRSAIIAAMLVAAGQSMAAAPGACDRRCMSTALDQYLGSMISHNVREAPLAATFRATENAVTMARGEGLMKSALGFGSMQRRYFDPVSHQAAFYGTVYENAGPALLSLRVRFDGSSIVESEAIVARKGEPLYNVAGQIKDQPRLERIDPKIRPTSREALLKTANAYFNALGGDKTPVPKVDGCTRVENGTKVTQRATPLGAAPPPAAQTPEAASAAAHAAEEQRTDCTSGLTSFAIKQVAHRRFPVVDTEAGVVLGVGLFHRPPGAVDATGKPRKRNLLHEYFAMDRGRMTEIFAVMRYIDHNEPDGTGW